MPINITIFPLVIAFLTVVIITPLSLIFIKKLGLIDDPKKHKHPAMMHTKPIPRGGGIPLFSGVLVSSLCFLPINKTTIALLLASLISLIIGSLDDKYDLSPYLRVMVNILCAIIVVAGGISPAFITNPFGGILHLDTVKITFEFLGRHSILLFSDILAVVWIIWVMNMLNWSKGVDGQMPGIVVISAIVIGLLGLRFSLFDPFTSLSVTLSFIIAGAMLGFLIYNFYPAKIFPGYGATSIYLLLAAVSIMSSVKLATAILVMGVPMIDGIFTIIRRLLSGKSPFWHDKKHLHHLLSKHGFGQRRIAIAYWLFSGILGTIALTFSSKGKFFALLILLVILGSGLLFLHTNQRHNHEI